MWKMEYINLSGCVHLTDTAMQRIGQALTTSRTQPRLSIACYEGEGGGDSSEDDGGDVCFGVAEDIENWCGKLKKVCGLSLPFLNLTFYLNYYTMYVHTYVQINFVVLKTRCVFTLVKLLDEFASK